MNTETIELFLFVGLGLYVLTSLMFLYLFLRTLWSKDGIGLLFLRILTFALFFGSSAIAFSRWISLYGGVSPDIGRVIAIVNPITLFGVGLYLNYLFHLRKKTPTDELIKKIKTDTTEIKKGVKTIVETK